MTATSSLADDFGHRRVRIIECATRAFLAEGYDRANIEAIAIAAGVSKLTIYRLFGDKAGLIAAVIEQAGQGLIRSCADLLDPSEPPRPMLARFGSHYVRWMLTMVGGHRHFEISRLLMEVSYHHPEIARAWHDLCYSGIAEPLHAYLQVQIDRGLIRGEDTGFLALHFIGILMYNAAASIAPAGTPAEAPDTAGIDALVERKVRLFLEGCATA